MIYNGVDLFTIAKVIEDNGERYEAETPALLPVASIDLPEEGSYTPVYKDGEVINAYAIGTEQEIKVNTKAIAPDFLNEILNGKDEPAFFDTGTHETNFYALGFKLSLYDGSYTYFSYLKGTIKVNSKSIETKQGTTAVIESITFYPLTTKHKFTYNGKPCRKVEVNTNKHNVIESGWLSIVWTPDNFLPVPAPIIEAEATTDNIEVALFALRSGDIVRYTTDGTTPTLESEAYTEPIVLNEATTIKAIECAICKHTSAVSTLNVNIDDLTTEAPQIYLTYHDNKTWIYFESEGKLYYTIDGKKPTLNSILWDGNEIEITGTTIVKAISKVAGKIISKETKAIVTPRYGIKYSAYPIKTGFNEDTIGYNNDETGYYINVILGYNNKAIGWNETKTEV